jgi:DnaJ domain
MTGGGDSGTPPGSKGPPPGPPALPRLDAPFPSSAKPGAPQPTPTGEILPIDHPLSASSKRLVPTPSDPSALAGLAPPSIAPLAPPPAAPPRKPTAPGGVPAARPPAKPPAARPPAKPPAAGSTPGAPPRPGTPATARPVTSPGTPPSGAPRPTPPGTAAPARSPAATPPRAGAAPVRGATPTPPGSGARPVAPPPLPPMTETSLAIPVIPLESEAAPLPPLGISIAPLTPPPVVVPAPAAPADPMDRVAWKAERLDSLDYFELLGIATDASAAVVKRAFYTESRAYHPDRFFHLTDEAFKARVHDVYKRVTEAYFVLRDDTRRRKYLADISGPDRATKLRFDEVAEKETVAATKKQAEEQIGTHPKGRQLFAAGVAELERAQYAAAERTLKMALTYEPQNALYKEKLAQVQEKLYEASRGNAFKIT